MASILLALGGWLTTQNPWWWILEALCIVGVVIFVVLSIAVHLMLRAVAPPLTKHQKRSVVIFVNKLERVAEHVRMPQPVIIFYVIRETIWPKQGGFVETISNDSQTLAPDFKKLRDQFM